MPALSSTRLSAAAAIEGRKVAANAKGVCGISGGSGDSDTLLLRRYHQLALQGVGRIASKLVDSTNWAEPALDAKRIPAKDFDIGGALLFPNNQGVVNWQPPAYSPQTGLFYIYASESYAMYYLATTDPRGAMGLGFQAAMI